MSAETPGVTTAHPHAPTVEDARKLFGVMAEFGEHDQLLAAAQRAYAEGYRDLDAFSPFPVEHLAEAIGHEYSPVPIFTLLGGIAGGLGGYFMEWYSMARLYPINVGGRPHNSWPNFIPITFELTILIASLSALVSLLILCRLPQPHHPVFNVPQFRRASIDRFFLFIDAKDPKFDLGAVRNFLEIFHPLSVSEVWDE